MATRRTIEAVAMNERGAAAVGAALVGALLGLQPAFGQDSSNVTVDVGHCLEWESAAQRRACFGAEVDAALKARGAAESDDSSVVTEDREADQSPSTGDENLSRRERRAQRRAERRAVDESRELEAAEDQYFGTVKTIRERIPDSYVITLEDGQIWEQTAPKRYPLRPGLEVRIYPTTWGDSYRLAGMDLSGYIQVRKVR